MLRLSEIKKTYKTKDLSVEALKGISLSFRQNEFVSILGPSGCGKTTLLNVIGGLDHYDSGDLVILGKSTHEFKERDWDVYRNHRIGFIFQSYNLIPQENVLQNVELALTIAGISKAEREKRAKAALDRVGLVGMYKKKPNQLSGGQCQRVAIARALVNEPDILLADEPTGALDSVTSIQIMDLIKEISKEKLVIMVTHNPEIAEKYSSRIIRLKDGLVIDDTNPYSEEEEKAEFEGKTPQNGREKAKMSWLTAFSLSAKNLVAKMKRSVLTVVAASIGIVGVSAVLAVSNGVTGYIDSIQDDMLSGNPVYVASSSLDLSTLMNAMSSITQTQLVSESFRDGKIDVDFMVEQLANLSSSLVNNDITEDYVAYIDDMPSSYYSCLEKYYGLNVFNNLYTDDTIHVAGSADKEVHYSLAGYMGYCEGILTKADGGQYSSYASLVSTLGSIVSQTLTNDEYVLSQYDILDEGGRLPKEANEMVLVLNHQNETTDLVLTLLGYYSQEQFETVIDYYTAKKNDELTPELEEALDKIKQVDISTIKEKTFTYYPNDDVFTKTYDESDPKSIISPFTYSYEEKEEWANDGMDMKIVGILAPKSSVKYGCLDAGLYYTKAFTEKFLSDGANSEIVKFYPTYAEKAAAYLGTDSDSISGYTSMPAGGIGILYNLPFVYHGAAYSITLGAGSSAGLGSISAYLLDLHDLGGASLPSKIEIYPTSFKDKYKVTDYLDVWNSDMDITLSGGKVIARADRSDVKYTDNLAVVIAIINGVIQIVTIALVAFTSLALVVSTVMIAIITYVSVMERIKEIGVIRALGGRTKDVSHLFNAETFMLGLVSGVFGILITYLFELLLNVTVGRAFSIGMIANLQWWVALIIIGLSILLTMIAGLIPAAGAAKKDPVVALRTE